MSKNKYKNNEPLNKKHENAFAEDDLRDELRDDLEDRRPSSQEPFQTDTRDDVEIIPEEFQHETLAAIDNERLQRVDAWDNAQTKVRPSTDLYPGDHVTEGGLGEFQEQPITDGMSREKMRETSDQTAGSDYGTPAPQRGFPWWWILLPLIILGIIYGLTRNPVNEENPPTSTTSQIPVQIISAELADHLAAFDLI